MRATLCRVVESQAVAATMRLVDTPQAQAILESALESSKPPIPLDCTGLHYLLSTPFRYPPSPWPSRFRGPTDPGVFYAAAHERTALAELAHWRLRVLLDAVDLSDLAPAPHTLFTVRVDAQVADVTSVRPVARRMAILHPDDYGSAQQWARERRDRGDEAIRYPSVRDRPNGICWALLSPQVFASPPRIAGTWLVSVTRDGVSCRSATEARAYSFTSAALRGGPPPV